MIDFPLSATDIEIAAKYNKASFVKYGISNSTLIAAITALEPEATDVLFYLYGIERQSGSYAAAPLYVYAFQQIIFGSETQCDGKLGPITYSRLVTALVSKEEEKPTLPIEKSGGLLINGNTYPVPGVKIVNYNDPDGFSFYRDTKKGYYGKSSSASTRVVAFKHWDAALSSKSAYKILLKRGYASCFGVDNPSKETGDVVVYEWLDPGRSRAVHGGKLANDYSFASFDYSNAVYIRYQDNYINSVGAPRPRITGLRNGGKSELLGLYYKQILAGMRVTAALHTHLGILPKFNVGGRKGEPTFFPPMQKDLSIFNKGNAVTIATHLEVTEKKWDIAGFQEQVIVLALLNHNGFADEFPWLHDNFKLSDTFWSDWLAEKKLFWVWEEIGLKEIEHE